MAIKLRTDQSVELTYQEADENFSSLFYSASISGNTLSLYYTGSSFAPTTNPVNIALPTVEGSKWTASLGGSISRSSDVSVVGSISATGAITSSAFIRTGGTSAQFLKANGSVDSNTYAPLNSPSFTGVPIAPTAVVGTNTNQVATTAFVNAEIANDAPTKSGTGATGTWGISISGNASSVNTVFDTTNADRFLTFVDSNNVSPGSEFLYTVDTLTYNPSLGILTADTIRATGDVVAYYSSDRRLKDNITPISNALEKVKQIGGYEFDWNDKQYIHEGHDVGVMAQEIEAVLPEIVTTRENGYKAVKYEKVVALLIEAIKEQQKQIDELMRR